MTDVDKLSVALFRLPRPLLALKGRVHTFLSSRLNNMFDQVDDTFFDLADRADNNRQQTMYFDAMRLIRMERKNIEHNFFGVLTQSFQQLGQHQDPELPTQEPEGLEVVENEQLEEIIALDTMVFRVSELCKPELEALNTRLSSMVPATVTMKNNPVGPDVICESFNEAVAHLELKLPVKLVLFKLFDRQVMVSLKDFLVEGNKRLRDMGVLPDLEQLRKARVEQRQQEKPPAPPPEQASVAGTAHSSSSPAPVSASASGETAGQPGPDSRATDSRHQAGTGQPTNRRQDDGQRYGQLLSQLKNLLHWGASGKSGSEAADTRQRIEGDQLVSMVGDLQQDWSNAVSAEADDSEGLLQLIDGHLERQGEASLGGTERGLVDLLDRLFVKVNHQTIACAQLATELRKLELPILQLALKDNTFLDREKHPARRLLNEIAEASIGYTEKVDVDEDPVARAISSVADELAGQPPGDHAALTQLLLNFIDLVEKERRRVAVLEQRLMEEATATEKVNHAHQAVVKVLMERVKGKTLPRFVVSFAEDAWCKVLFLNHVRSGQDSEEWHGSIRLLDRLLELVAQGQTDAGVVAPVLATIKDSLENVSYDDYDMGRLLGAMEQYFRGEPVTGSEESLRHGVSASPLQSVLVDALRTNIPGNPAGLEDDSAEHVDEQYLRRADSLTRGAWVEMTDEGADKRRCKLAGVVLPSGKFIFVNRQGAKVSEKHRNRVAMDLQTEKLRPLEKTRLFDRALEGVVGEMCQSKSVH
ncbi:DUF1631 family protein [uncultured Porticoccus sp.]|uniref:DUF1631 family protein n=1 Tax=uncultured Porticoccus sp. TaxID=1256050 RepID=UPI002634D745|nr:DUF1631 family protein [uncultured Porticoccus sp.]